MKEMLVKETDVLPVSSKVSYQTAAYSLANPLTVVLMVEKAKAWPEATSTVQSVARIFMVNMDLCATRASVLFFLSFPPDSD